MSEALPVARGYRFGPFLVDSVRRLLWRDGRVVPLTPKTLDVLLFLVQHRERIVDKDQFLRQLWGDTVVEEGTLVRHVSSLRKAMHLLPGNHEYIVTVPGHGYRFVARVIELDEIPAELPTTVEAAVASAVPIEPAAADPPIEAHHQPAKPDLPGAPWLRARWRPAAAGAVAVCVLVLWGAALPASRRPTAPPPQRSLRQVTFSPGMQSEPAWSPDSQRLAFTSDRAGNLDIWIQSISDSNPTRLTTSPARDWQPDWSSDGEWIAFRSERDGGGLYVVPARGGLERRIADKGYQPRWSPDGARILFVASMLNTGAVPRAYVVGLDGRPPQAVGVNVVQELRSDISVAWHPDGRRISIWGRHKKLGWTFETISLDGDRTTISERSTDVDRQIKSANLTLGRFVWARSGHYLYFEGRSNNVRNLWRVAVDPASLEWTGGPERLTTGSGRDTDLALSADGTTMAFSVGAERTRVWSFPIDVGSGTLRGAGEPLTDGGGDEEGPDASSNGGKLVYRTTLGTQQELREVSLLDGRERLLLSGKGTRRTNVRWSPDGSRLAYDVFGTSATGAPTAATAILFTHDGSERMLTTPGERNWVTFGWSPDGASILGSCRQGGGRLAACLLPVSGAPHAERDVRTITADPGMDLWQEQFSPDQRRIVFMAVPVAEEGVSKINVVAVSGGAWTPITDGRSFDDKPRWAPDGRTVFFVSSRDGALNVWARHFDVASGRPVGDAFRVTSFDTSRQMLSPASINSIEIAVVGERLLLPITEASGHLWMLGQIDK